MSLLRKLSIRSQLSIIALSITFALLFILCTSYFQMAKIIGSNSEKYTSDHFKQVKQTIHSNKDVLERIMTNIAINSDVQNFLTDPENVQSLILSKRVDSLLINSRTLKEGIIDIIIHGEDGRSIDIAGGNRVIVPYLGLITEGQPFYFYGLQNFGSHYSSELVFLIGVKIKNLQPGEQFNNTIGTLFLVVSPQALMDKISDFSLQMNALSMYVDRQMKVALSGSDSQISGIELENMGYEQAGVSKRKLDWNGNKYVASIEYLPELKGSIVDMIPKDMLMRDMNSIHFSFIWIFVFGAVFVAVMFTVITSNILLNKNELLARELLSTNGVLNSTQQEKKKAELAFLRSQINPHFLYNTLEMIKGMAAVKGAQEIREAASLLGSIYHYSIKGGGIVPLHTELTIVESYLQIQKLRFGARFSVKFDIEGVARNCQVPKMILQPIVENAVYHGLELNEQNGLLSISAHLDMYRDLIIVIEDDGVGMNQMQLERVQTTLSDAESSGLLVGEGVNSIGISNVNARIKLICGPEYGLDITSKEGSGTRVRVKLSTKGEFSNVLQGSAS